MLCLQVRAQDFGGPGFLGVWGWQGATAIFRTRIMFSRGEVGILFSRGEVRILFSRGEIRILFSRREIRIMFSRGEILKRTGNAPGKLDPRDLHS